MTENIEAVAENGQIIMGIGKARETITEAISEAMNKIKKETIVNAFKHTGFSLKTDGSEEHLARVETRSILKIFDKT